MFRLPGIECRGEVSFLNQMSLRTKSVILSALFFAIANGQQSVLTVPENLITEGLPPIPMSVVDSLSRYQEARGAYFNGWRPGRLEQLVGTQITNAAQTYSVAMPGGDRHQLTFFPDGVQVAFYGPKNPDWFVFQKDTGGNEFYQYYRYDLSTGNSTLLTDGKSRNTDPFISGDGKTMYYVSTRRTGADTDLYSVDVESPKSDHLVAALGGVGWTPTDVSPDGKTVLLLKGVSVSEAHLFLYDLATGAKRELMPSQSRIAYGYAGFSKSVRKVYYTSDEGGEFLQLKELNLDSGKVENLSAPIHWDVESVALARDRSRLAFSVNDNGMSELYELDLHTKKFEKLKGIPPATISDLAWNSDDHTLGFSMTSATGSDVYSYNDLAQKLTRWTFSETGGLNPEVFQEPTLVKWRSFDGLELSGWLTLPPAKFKGPRPVWINIHGGPEAESRPGFLGARNYFLNEMGIAVLKPNVRGSTGFGKTFADLDTGMKRGDTYRDIGALLDWIKGRSDLDSNKIFVSGTSYGGHMTYAVSYLYADRIALSMPSVGMTNLVSFLENTSPYRRDLRRVKYGDERVPEMRAYLEKIAPINHAEEIKKPIFIVAGQNDPRVPISEATGFKDKIKKTNPNTWYLVAKDEGHGFSKKNNIDFQLQATVLFLRTFLFGDKQGD